MYISVRIVAGAKKELIETLPKGRLKIWVKQPAQQNLANTRVHELVARHLNLPHMEPTPRPWYTKKRYLLPAGVLVGLSAIGMAAGSPTPAPATQAVPVVQELAASAAAASSSAQTTEPTPAATEVRAQVVAPAPAPAKPSCNPNYSGCLKPDASDYDCAGGSGNGPYYTGPVRVIGYDQYGLDGDHNGMACE